MGRATISGGGPDGLYTIAVDLGSERVNAEIARLTSAISLLGMYIDNALNARDALAVIEENRRVGLVAATDAYIAALQTGDPAQIKAATPALLKATELYYTASANVQSTQTRVDRLKFDRAAAQKELAAKQAITTEQVRAAWCCDLVEDASGEVPTVEIPGETNFVLIAPRHPGNSWAPDAGDGQLLARPAMTGPQAYFNAAILPGWQRWMPTYRAGVISNIDYASDNCTVTLFDIRSSAQSLGVNQQSILDFVPISYMDCNASAFEDGDEVVVSFPFDWDMPTVIGFMSNPKACGCLRSATFFEDMDHTGQLLPGAENAIPIEDSPGWVLTDRSGFSIVPPPEFSSGALVYPPGTLYMQNPFWDTPYEPYGTVEKWYIAGLRVGGVGFDTLHCRVYVESFEYLNPFSVPSKFGRDSRIILRAVHVTGNPLDPVTTIDFAIRFYSDGDDEFTDTDASFRVGVFSDEQFFTCVDGWHTFRVEYSTAEQRLYMDDVLVATATEPNVPNDGFCGRQIAWFNTFPRLAGEGSTIVLNRNKLDYALLQKAA